MSIGMLIFSIIVLIGNHYIIINYNIEHWKFSLYIFIIAWVGQFIGHKIEGKKPSFIKDIQFLFIGPAWLIGFIYKKLNIKY